jgi:DNA-directed RNA polymerase subunit F
METQLTYKNYILKELLASPKGLKDKSQIAEKFCKKFDKKLTTFNVSFLEAKKEFVEIKTREKEAVVSKSLEHAKKYNILDASEAGSILTDIAKGVVRKIKYQGKEIEIFPTITESKGAIELLGKFNGWFAPTKVSHNIETIPDININISKPKNDEI